MRGMVSELRAAAASLDEATTRLALADPGATAFGAGGAGLLGEIGREAYGRFSAALAARVREARAHEERVRELAEGVARAAGGLADAEGRAGAEQRRGSGEVMP